MHDRADDSDASPTHTGEPLSIGQCVSLSCLLEVAAPKPGNVHRGADFHDATLVDFMSSAVAIGPVLEQASESGAESSVGESILNCVRATRAVSQTNTNLGIILLLAPLAIIPRDTEIHAGVKQILENLTSQDARQIYAAIDLASAGGMQPVDDDVTEMDVASEPPDDLLVAMEAARERDMIAEQYCNGFHEVIHAVLPLLLSSSDSQVETLTARIINAHLHIMRDFPDSLIRRKLGVEMARESAARAGRVLDARQHGEEIFQNALAEFDFWLRSDSNRRNPGTTADLIAAGLFIGLRDGRILPPFH